MATEVETRKKISALPEVQTLDGFYTVGYKMVDGTPQSKKVNLTYVDTAAQNANTKANLAQEKATLADTKANLADQKASLADEKATLAAQKAALAEQAAGSVDTAKTAAQQAAASANSAASGATAAAAEADEAAEAATEAAAAAVATNTEVTEDEAARVLAETARASAEASRVSAETARSTAEGQRSSAESTRQTKETERQGSETARGTAEANRATAETARVQAEQARVSAESSRASAETARGTAETERASAETSRASSETSRASAETARASAESSRASAETSRVSAEEARAAAEEDRDEAEESRDTAETARATAESTRVESETARGTAETTRGTNEAARVSAETARASAETARATAESNRASAETARVNAETSRTTTFSADHDQAISDHTQAETDHSQAASDHTQAGTDHTQAGEDHTTAQEDHANETARQTAETNRGTAETARATAEAARVVAEAARVAEYGQFEFDINEALNAIEGQQDLPVFNNTTAYAAGQYVRYTPTGSDVAYAYRFTTAHPAGPWIGTDAVQTSVFGELKELIIGDEELLHVCLSSTDGLLDVEGIGVSITFDDGSPQVSLTTNAQGVASATIAKGKTFNVSVADQTGYRHNPTQKFKANSNERYVNIAYSPSASGTCTVTVSFSVAGGQQGVTPFVGKSVSLILSNNQSVSTTVDANGVATFTDVPREQTGYVILPAVSGYGTPSRINFSTNAASIGLSANYTIVTAGLYMVNQDGDEVDIYAWDPDDTCVALHIATQTLIEKGADYYVKPESLCQPWLNTTKQWATSNVNFPNVPYDSNDDYDGQGNTSKMLSDAGNLGIQSPAAEYVSAQRLTLNGNTAIGYLGTKRQFQSLVDNKAAIYDMVLLAGFTPVFYSKNIWVSTQYSTTNAWYWNSGSWDSYGIKNFNAAVVPFFAI